jgi:hypothetical protein
MPSAKTFLKTAAMAIVAIAIVNRIEPAAKIVYNR